MIAEAGSSSPGGARFPWTPGRAAELAAGPLGRFWLAAGITAALLGAALFRVAHVGWLPAVNSAVTALPVSARIDDGRLVWPEARRVVLADNSWLAIVVNPTTSQPGVQAADVQIELTAHTGWLTCFLGYLPLPYPPGYIIDLDREQLPPLWAAWRPYVLAGVFGVGMVGALLWGGVLALLLSPLLVLYAWLLGRTGGFGRLWRLGMAAQAPGCWLLTAGLVAYSFRFLGIPLLLAVMVGGWLILLLFLLIAPWQLPGPEDEEEAGEMPAEATNNPFGEADEQPDPRNPFGGPATAPLPDTNDDEPEEK